MIFQFLKPFFLINAGVISAQRPFSNDTLSPLRKLAQSKKFLAALTGMSNQQSTDYLKNYGCYCHINGNRNVGALEGYGGEGLDELDEACRDLARSQKCFLIDSYSNDCTIDDSYRSWTVGTNTFCGDKNDPDWKNRQDCRYDICLGEQKFALRVAELINNGFLKNPDFQDLSGAEYAAKCQQRYVGGPSLACCGSVPNRYPYNSDVKECCPDNTIATVGMC